MKDYVNRRNADLCAAARRAIDNGAMTLDEVVDYLVTTGAPSFYVSRDYAYIAVLQFRSGRMSGARPSRREKWKAFDAEVRRYMARHRYVSLIEAVDYVAHEVAAPRFYLERATLVRMLQYMNRRSRITSRRDLFGVNRLGAKFIRHSPARA